MAAARHLELEFCHSGPSTKAVLLSCHNLVSNGRIGTKLGWSHDRIPWCPRNVRHDVVTMSTAVNGALNIQQLWASGGQFWWNLVHHNKLRPQWQSP